MSLGEDHTAARRPASDTPEACRGAATTSALGRIVEAASRSRFWKEMAIFVIEDDAQNGPDHVDAHRTVGLVISPWCKRGRGGQHALHDGEHGPDDGADPGPAAADAVRRRRDADVQTASGRRRSSPRTRPLTPKVDVEAKNHRRNAAVRRGILVGWTWRGYDRAPEDALNRILWRMARGDDEPYPTPIHRALFTAAPPARESRGR